jgi:hypothetical protein
VALRAAARARRGRVEGEGLGVESEGEGRRVEFGLEGKANGRDRLRGRGAYQPERRAGGG